MVIALTIKYLDFTSSYIQTEHTIGIGSFTCLGIKIGSLIQLQLEQLPN